MNNAQRWPVYGRTSGMRCVSRGPSAQGCVQRLCDPSMPYASAQSLQTAAHNLTTRFSTDEKKPAFSSRFIKWSAREITLIFDKRPSGRCCATLSRYARRKPPSEVLILFFYRRKKTCFFKQVYKMVGERGLRLSSISALRAVAAQRCLATLGANLLRRFSSSFSTDEKKPAFSSRFIKWSAREDSNLRPTGPKPVALPSCATRR